MTFPHPGQPAEIATPLQLLSTAFTQTQKLLSGRSGRARWGKFWVLAAMAGITGIGAPPPPLGLLYVAVTSSPVKEQTLGDPVVVGGFVCLALLLIGMGGIGRAFTFAFLEGILTGEPKPAHYRQHLRSGIRHFAWSAAVSLPLYLLLFGVEASIAHGTMSEVTRLLGDPSVTEDAVAPVLGAAILQYLLVLVPWTLLTFPLFILQYELVPSAMITGGRPALASALELMNDSLRRPGRHAVFLLLRALIHLVGETVSPLALLVALPVFAVVGGALLAVGWGVSLALGGIATASGVSALSVFVSLAILVLYILYCGAMVPLSILTHRFALSFSDTRSPSDRPSLQ